MSYVLRDTCQRANTIKKTCKTLGYMKSIVCKISPVGGGGGAKNYLFHGLWSCRYIFIENIEHFVTSIARAVSIRREITVTILFTSLVLLSRLV